MVTSQHQIVWFTSDLILPRVTSCDLQRLTRRGEAQECDRPSAGARRPLGAVSDVESRRERNNNASERAGGHWREGGYGERMLMLFVTRR